MFIINRDSLLYHVYYTLFSQCNHKIIKIWNHNFVNMNNAIFILKLIYLDWRRYVRKMYRRLDIGVTVSFKLSQHIKLHTLDFGLFSSERSWILIFFFVQITRRTSRAPGGKYYAYTHKLRQALPLRGLNHRNLNDTPPDT